VVLVFHDVTEKRRAQDALRQSKERLDLALLSARMATFDWDIVTNQRTWSPGVHALLGTNPGNFTGAPEEFFNIIHPEDRRTVQAALARAVEKTGVYETEYRAVWPDGHLCYMAARGKILRDDAGRAVWMTGICWDISEHKRAEEVRALLAAIVESSDDAILSKDVDGTILSWNAGAERLLGYRASEMVGQSIRRLLPADRQDEESQIMARLQSGERVEHFETVRLTKAGGRLDVSVTLSPLRDASGRIIGASKIVRDITESKLKETELQKLNRTLKALHESSQAMARATAEKGYLNQVCQDLLANCGYAMVWIGFAEPDETRTVRPVASAGFEEGYLETLKITWADNELGRGPTGTAIRTGQPCACRNMLTDPAFAPWRAEALKRGYVASLVLPLLTGGRAFGAITIYSRQAGAFSPDEIRLLTELADDVSYCVRSLRAMAERQLAEEQLRLLSTAVESAANGIVITDQDGRILWVNPAFTRLTGYSRGEAVGRNPRILQSGRTPPELYQAMWNSLLKGEPWHGELVNRNKDGSLHPEELTITPVRMDGVKTTHYVAIKQDISERQRVQAALDQKNEEVRRSNRDLEQFAYIASHDLQEPLRAVGGYVKLLHRRFPEHMDAKAIEYINGAAEGAARMERLISDLLAFSRLGSHGGDFAPADLETILNAALHNLQTSLQNSQAKITRDTLPTLTVDATQMMQLFQNLIGNAIKFRGERPPEIHVGAQQEPGRWVFSVRDNGIGIESLYFERIFQIFQRLHTRKYYPGTGIGLAICKKIVERHHGAIWVESTPGQGTTFHFSIPDNSASPSPQP
jgi:PAS domain S-box-containing protein